MHNGGVAVDWSPALAVSGAPCRCEGIESRSATENFWLMLLASPSATAKCDLSQQPRIYWKPTGGGVRSNKL
jgi:hypothetical protein